MVVSSLQQYLKQGIIKDIKHVSYPDQLADIFTKKGVSTEKIIDAVSKGYIKDPEDKFSKWRKFSISSNERSIISDGLIKETKDKAGVI